MLIIPVIDIYDGNVVHAHAGQRESYKNIQSPLCHGSNPLVILKALLSLHPFTTIYIADLNAIKDEGNNNGIIAQLMHDYPAICFWLDKGICAFPSPHPLAQLRRVVGSETGITRAELLNQYKSSDTILSLDFFNNEFMGERAVLENGDVWPDDIIVMSLDRVGTNLGPEISRLDQIQALAGNKRVYAAGGVRCEDDLQSLCRRNISGVLLATTLHNGKIDRQALEKYSQNQA